MSRTPSLVAATLLAVACLTAAARAQTDSCAFDTTSYPEPMTAAARLTTQRCATCHSLKRVIAADLPADAWGEVVHRMAKKEKSGISPPEEKRITDFFLFRAKRPAAAGGAPASRPVTPGGPAAFPSPTHAAIWHADIPAALSLPVTTTLGPYTCTVTSVTATRSAAGAPTLTAHVVVTSVSPATSAAPDTTSPPFTADLVLGVDATGEPVTSTLTLRTWTIAGRSFQLALALYAADRFADPGTRPDITLAALVIRGSG